MRGSNPIFRSVLPRLIRLRDAPLYLGMDSNRFNRSVRPYLTEIPIGEQGIAFDRLDLDAWAEDRKSRYGRPGCKDQPQEQEPRATHPDQASPSAVRLCTSRRQSMELDYLQVLARAISSGLSDC